MAETYQIREGLGVFWRSNHTLQIGLDWRTGVTIDGLKKNEQDFVAKLSRPVTEAELDFVARRHRLRPARAAQILSMLRRAGVLRLAEGEGPDLSRACVAIDRLDPLGVSIGLGLVRCGVGALVFDDTARVGPDDHPALLSRSNGLTRSRAFLSALRSVSPRVEHGGEPSLTVVTGSRLIAPSRTHGLWDAGKAHLLAWVEEVDTCVGPLIEPGRGPCAECIQATRREVDEAWSHLAPQAALARPVAAGPSVRDLASALAVRAVLGFLTGGDNTLRRAQWRIADGSQAPQLVVVEAHPACGCTHAAPPLTAVKPAASAAEPEADAEAEVSEADDARPAASIAGPGAAAEGPDSGASEPTPEAAIAAAGTDANAPAAEDSDRPDADRERPAVSASEPATSADGQDADAIQASQATSHTVAPATDANEPVAGTDAVADLAAPTSSTDALAGSKDPAAARPISTPIPDASAASINAASTAADVSAPSPADSADSAPSSA